jgi:uncharacterized protein YndB with AHSA1/START domain
MSKQVEIDIVLPQPPERVWRAITDAKALEKWLMPNDFRPRIGHRFRFVPKRGREKRNERVIECEVIELSAPHRLAYTWRESAEGAPDLVTWVLEPVEAGTRVRLEHTRLTDVQASANTVTAIGAELRSVAPARFLLARLARFLPGKQGRRRLVRGRVRLSAGSAFTCVAVSPCITSFEEVRR